MFSLSLSLSLRRIDVAGFEDGVASRFRIGATPCIKINAILIKGQDHPHEDQARSVLQDYTTTTSGWYSELPPSGGGIEEPVVKMLYDTEGCDCP